MFELSKVTSVKYLGSYLEFLRGVVRCMFCSAVDISELFPENTLIYYELPSRKRRPRPLLNRLYYLTMRAVRALSTRSSKMKWKKLARTVTAWKLKARRQLKVWREHFSHLLPVFSVISKLGSAAGSVSTWEIFTQPKKSYQQIHQDKGHDNHKNNKNEPRDARHCNIRWIEQVVKVELSYHHDSSLHDTTTWISKSRNGFLCERMTGASYYMFATDNNFQNSLSFPL